MIGSKLLRIDHLDILPGVPGPHGPWPLVSRLPHGSGRCRPGARDVGAHTTISAQTIGGLGKATINAVNMVEENRKRGGGFARPFER